MGENNEPNAALPGYIKSFTMVPPPTTSQELAQRQDISPRGINEWVPPPPAYLWPSYPDRDKNNHNFR